MTLEEAIKHTKDIAKDASECTDCRMEHKQLTGWLEELLAYRKMDKQGRLLRLPCKVGDTVYVDAAMLPVSNMECYEDTDREVPTYFQARVVSFRSAKRNWMKIAVREKWLYEWIDDETGPDSNYIECEKNFTVSLSGIGKTVFLTREEAEAKLKEMEESHD